MEYAVAELDAVESSGFCPRGGALQLWKSRDHECMLSGPSETGKTYACLQKLDALLWKYPGCQAVVVRKTLASFYTSVLRTYKNVLGHETPVHFYGGEKPEWAHYPNGSRAFFAGMDNPQKALSSERDFIYVNQAEELQLDDWETLTTRSTGRAANAPYSQIFGDCNPGPPTHWIKQRAGLRFLESRHEDNPRLFDEGGKITERGSGTLAILDRLTGVRKQRLRHGRWVQAEGVVYEGWDRAVHLVPRFEIPKSWTRLRSFDFGYKNPFVCGYWAIDNDGRMYLYREIYHTKRTVKVHAEQIKRVEQWYKAGDDGTPLRGERGELRANPDRERFAMSVADHDLEDRATLDENDIKTAAADKAITRGIQAVEERLKVQGDGKPRLFILEGSLVERDESLAEERRPCCTAEEFDCYAWRKTADGRPNKEVPLDADNHGMDQMRYAVMALDSRRKLKFF